MKRKEARYANGKRIYKAFFGLVVVSCVSEASRLVTSASGKLGTRGGYAMHACLSFHRKEPANGLQHVLTFEILAQQISHRPEGSRARQARVQRWTLGRQGPLPELYSRCPPDVNEPYSASESTSQARHIIGNRCNSLSLSKPLRFVNLQVKAVLQPHIPDSKGEDAEEPERVAQ